MLEYLVNRAGREREREPVKRTPIFNLVLPLFNMRALCCRLLKHQ
uniref:Uncharacterized protein n=1 Tax=Anguilla anguilla TaxID=7936 RepID=A0A0E9TWN8_ANGAN